MNTTDWLIAATVAGPILGAIVSPGLGRGLAGLARARAQRVKHIDAAGSNLFHRGVPLTEVQFREAFAAMQAELDELAPPAERSEWELQRQYHAINKFSMLAGTFPQAFPMLGDADSAWDWYSTYGAYAPRPEYEPQPDIGTADPQVSARRLQRLTRTIKRRSLPS